MKPNDLMNITELAWDDIHAHGEGSEFGVVVIVLHATGDELLTQVGSNVAPQIVKAAIQTLAADWQRTGGEFITYPPKSLRKAV